jgi:hypothetical protein
MSPSRYGRNFRVCTVDFDRVNQPALVRNRELIPSLPPAPPLVIDDPTLVAAGWKPIEDSDRFRRER